MIGAMIPLVYDEARRIWIYRRLAAAVAAIILGAGGLYIVRLPDLYDAWGQILVNKQASLSAATQGVSLIGDSYGDPTIVQKILLNDENLKKVVTLRDPAATRFSEAQMAAAVGALRSRIRVSDQGDGFFEFHYGDTRPGRAQRTVQLLLNQFISRNVDRNRDDLGQAEKFLDQQINSYNVMLADSQTKIADFRERYPRFAAALLRAGGGADLAAPLTEYLPADPGGAAPAAVEQPPPPPAEPAKPSAASERVTALEARLASLRTTYTDAYPDVVATKRQLAEAVTELAFERSLTPSPRASSPASGASPARVARRGVRRLVSTPVSPAVAAEWSDLQRNDDILRGNYRQLIARREATRVSQAIYGAEGAGKYQITREPTVPVVPVGPQRPLYFALVAFLAVTGGLGAAYLRGAMTGVLVSPGELEQMFQLPVVGTVSWERAWHTRPRTGVSPLLTAPSK